MIEPPPGEDAHAYTSRQMTWSKLASIIHYEQPIEHFKDMMIYLYAKPRNRSYEETHPAQFHTEYGTFGMPVLKPEKPEQIFITSFGD